MAVLEIAQIGEPVLREQAIPVAQEEIETPAIQSFIDDLVETMRDANGAGLAAIQVYRPIRICAVDVRAPNPRYPYMPGIPLTVMINPEITPLTEETFDNYEGCLSVPNIRGLVARCVEIKLRYLDRNAQMQEEIVKGISAGVYQHECDHLDGKLFIDGVKDPNTLTTWPNFERHHQSEFFKQAEAIVRQYGS